MSNQPSEVDELDEILFQVCATEFDNGIKFAKGKLAGTARTAIDEAKVKIQALIASKVLEARIDELENQLPLEWNAMNSEVIARRIKSLQAQKESTK